VLVSEKKEFKMPFLAGRISFLSEQQCKSDYLLNERLLRRGISMLSLGITKRHIFTYSLEHLKNSDKVRFYYALKGRDGKSGILGRTGTSQLGRAVLIASPEHQGEIAEFLKHWKCPFTALPVSLEEPR